MLAMTLVMSPVLAASRTGLESSLIKEWHSEVNRADCPDFLYPSHSPSIVTGEKVYKANCARCHGQPPSQDPQVISYMRKQSPEKQFERICGGKHQMIKALSLDERWDSLLYMYFRLHEEAAVLNCFSWNPYQRDIPPEFHHSINGPVFLPGKRRA